MAKGNPILGMAKGSVGDVVFYRQNGQQMLRARNRSPKNPKSDGQLYQRALLATVGKAYQAGKVIFDHSFQGRSVPDGSYREFLKANLNYLRTQLAADVQEETSAANARVAVVGPGSSYPVANSYIVSKGTLIQNIWSISLASGATGGNLKAAMVAANSGETVSQYCSRLGLIGGEIFTIVGFGSFEAVAFDKSVPTTFGFIRLIVKSDAPTSDTAMSAATIGDMFYVDQSGTQIPDSSLISGGITLDQVVSSCTNGAMGVIRSRENSGERSNCQLVFNSDNSASALIPTNGIKSAANILSAWRAEDVSLANSPLILEGGGF